MFANFTTLHYPCPTLFRVGSPAGLEMPNKVDPSASLNVRGKKTIDGSFVGVPSEGARGGVEERRREIWDYECSCV